jgi:hypothetical protein
MPSFCQMLGAAVLALLTAMPASAQTARNWNFKAYLDDSAIGYHRFALREQGTERELKSEARFEVKILFVTAYRYAHEATESWRANCLASLNSRTDDNGDKLSVATARDGERLAVTTGRGRANLDGCVMTFAYWNPEILRQTRLLNSQTGEYETVKIATLADEQITVRGAPVTAKHYRITGPKNPIELWYSAQGEWLQLDSTLEGGKRLRYRLE